MPTWERGSDPIVIYDGGLPDPSIQLWLHNLAKLEENETVLITKIIIAKNW